MTSNFPEFKEFVESKFESLSNFSFLVTGSFQTYQGLENSKDTRLITKLLKLAMYLDFDREKVEITDFDREKIKARMGYILKTHKNESHWLRKNNISHSYFSAVKNGKIVRKNLAYERLITKLGL